MLLNKENTEIDTTVDLNSVLKSINPELGSISMAKYKFFNNGNYIFALFAHRGNILSKVYAINMRIIDSSVEVDVHKSMKENKLGHKASQLNIGPKIYGSFYYHNTRDNILSVINELVDIIRYMLHIKTQIVPNSTNIYVQFTVTDLYEFECFKYLTYTNNKNQKLIDEEKIEKDRQLTALPTERMYLSKKGPTNAEKIEIVRQMCEDVSIGAKHGIYCYGVRPDDFVVSIVKYDKYMPLTRLINFNMCTDVKSELYEKINEPEKTPYNGHTSLKYINMFEVSVLVQIFIICLLHCAPEYQTWLYDGFKNTYLETYFEFDDWRANIAKYTKDACDIYEANRSLPVPHITPEFIYIHRVSGVVSDYKKYAATELNKMALVEKILDELTLLKNYIYAGKFESKRTVKSRKLPDKSTPVPTIIPTSMPITIPTTPLILQKNTVKDGGNVGGGDGGGRDGGGRDGGGNSGDGVDGGGGGDGSEDIVMNMLLGVGLVGLTGFVGYTAGKFIYKNTKDRKRSSTSQSRSKMATKQKSRNT